MSSAALKGNVEVNYIKLGAYRFFVAPLGTSIDEKAAFDTENPVFPWRDLGLASNDSTMKHTTNMFDLKAGIPALRKKKWIIERDSEMNLVLEEFSPYNLARAIWQNQASIKTFVDTPAVAQAPVANTLGGTLYTLGAVTSDTVFDLVSVVGLAIGNRVVTETLDASLPASVNFSVITDITGSTVTVDPALPSGVPTIGDKLRKLLFTNGEDSTSLTFKVADGTQFTVDQFVALAQLEDDLPNSIYEFRVAAINGNVLTFDRAIGTSFVPEPFIGEVESFKIPFGGGDTNRFALLGVWDDLGGGQMIVMMPNATASGDLVISYKAVENLKFPMNVMADYFSMNLLDEDSMQTIAASPTPTTGVFTVDDGSLFTVGQTVVVDATEALLDNSLNKGVILSIATDAITLADPLAVLPLAGWKIKVVNQTIGVLDTILHLQNDQS